MALGEVSQERFQQVIDYTVRRSARRRKTVQISVVDGNVIVAAPKRTPSRELDQIVRDRIPWIRRKLSEEAGKPAPPQFVTGEKLPYLGEDVSLTVTLSHDPKPSARLARRRLQVSVPVDVVDEQRTDTIRAALAAWFRERAAETLPDIVKRWLPDLGGDGPTRILIRNQKQRWGSCSTDGTLRFNWRVIMLPSELIDYIVVHELAHLKHQNHSREYWDHVTAAMPDAIQRRKALRQAGQKLPTL